MNAQTPITDAVALDPLAKLREPFPANQISKLPKQSKAQTEEVKSDRSKGVNCQVCGGWHHKNAVHLDYVGHAALTLRLLETDPHWSWEPVAFGPDGLPVIDRNGGLWIRLTICGVTRLGYGHADGKQGGDAVKEAIGDALRNAGMRFGAALDLWHKGDLHGPEEPTEPQPSAEEQAIKHLRSCAVDRGTFTAAWEANKAGWRGVLDDVAWKRVLAERNGLAKQISSKEAAAEEPKSPAGPDAPPSGNPFDDEIPF